jgi:hypothetical protein
MGRELETLGRSEKDFKKGKTMKARQAVNLFHGAERYNCAQAVLAAYQAEAGVSDCAIMAASRAGGGMAKGGTCGALHGALVLLDDPAVANQVAHDFSAIAGSPRCREIRGMKRISCRECVSLAAKLVEQHADRLQAENPTFAVGLKEREEALLPMASACQRVAEQSTRPAAHAVSA